MKIDSQENVSGMSNGIELSLDELDHVVGGRMVSIRPREEQRSGSDVVPTEHFSFNYEEIK